MTVRTFSFFVVLNLYTIWKLRNNRIFKGKRCFLEEELKVLYSRFKEFSTAAHIRNCPPTLTPVATTSWDHPSLGVIKINTDASIGKGLASIGLVVRNHYGRVVKIQALKENIEFPEAAEVAAILKAVSLATEDGHLNLCYESDAKNVI
nr:uncharacterized protein LOC125422004 [Ziziphus jujuba var. spinosa]